MTPLELIYALTEEIRRGVSSYRLKADEDGLQPVSVIEGYVPRGYFERLEVREQPLICVQLDGVEDDAEGSGELSVADVAIVISVYNEGSGGWLELMNLTETVRRHLLTHRLIDRRYRLILPMNTDYPERQAAMPFWYAEIDARYMIHQPQTKEPTFRELHVK